MSEPSLSPVPQDEHKYIVLNRSNAAGDNAPFSDGVLVGDTLYIAGHLGIDPATGRPGATPEQEARLLIDTFKRTIESANMSMDDLVYVQVYCSDVSLYDVFNNIYRAYFHGNYPARAFLGAGNLLFNARYQLMGIAVKKQK
jgi:2-iminobutanoate/2-iminopropanoate deaminase